MHAPVYARIFIEDSAQLGRSAVTLLVPARAALVGLADL